MFWLSRWAGSESFCRIWPHGEREGGSGTDLTEGVNFVFSRNPDDMRRDKRDSNVSGSASQRRVTKRTVAYQPAVLIRLSRSLGFPTCLFLASPLSGRTSGAQWRQERSNFFLGFRCLTASSRKAFHGLQKGQVHLRNTNCKKNIFWMIDSGVTTRGA